MKVSRNRERVFTPTGIEGIEQCVVWNNNTGGGAAIVRMEAGSKFPRHGHPGWEQLYVLQGSVMIGGEVIEAGDYLITDAGEIHAVEVNEASELWVFSEKGIEATNHTACGNNIGKHLLNEALQCTYPSIKNWAFLPDFP